MSGTDDVRGRLEAAILGAPQEFTSAEMVDGAPFDEATVLRLWRALGFAESAGDETYTAADARALDLLGKVVHSGLLDEETIIRMTRAVGHTMSRLADWEVATLTELVERNESPDDPAGSRIEVAHLMVREVQPAFEELLIHAWRRHLAAAVLRIEAMGTGDHDLHSADYTIGFADLVGFSAFSNQHTQDEVGELVERFENDSFDATAAHGGRVIKTLGDSVLFVAEDATAAYLIAEDIVRQTGEDETMPDVRIGLATGEVNLRRGDVFGPAVNLAARMTAVARRNRIICDKATAALLPADEFKSRVLPLRPVRGFGDIEPVAVRRRKAVGADPDKV